MKPSNLPLPNDPIEPYLLTKDNGPFMVMAKSFRGPDAERFALALVPGASERVRTPRVHSAHEGLPHA